MLRTLLQLLLALTLLTNGVSAPWAMARMGHAGAHHGHGAQDHSMQDRAAHDAAQVPHRHDHPHDAGTAPDDTPPDGMCCDSAVCRCGCMLPPALPFALHAAAAPALVRAPAPPSPRRVLAPRIAPPFRPPAA